MRYRRCAGCGKRQSLWTFLKRTNPPDGWWKFFNYHYMYHNPERFEEAIYEEPHPEPFYEDHNEIFFLLCRRGRYQPP
ncbi:MAG: hypothetical protein OEN01_12720 [Candidatus Krumholzibacteria bacterium]|nr:hypothetical protein [Candidatus Krumholzibacteria bacterium]